MPKQKQIKLRNKVKYNTHIFVIFHASIKANYTENKVRWYITFRRCLAEDSFFALPMPK